jgi:hypothetical protein
MTNDRTKITLDNLWEETGYEDMGISFPNQAYDRSHLPESLEQNIDLLPPYPQAGILGEGPNVSHTEDDEWGKFWIGLRNGTIVIGFVLGITYAILKWLGVL